MDQGHTNQPADQTWEEGSAFPTRRRVTVRDLQKATDAGLCWPMLTSYDALTAGVFERAGVPILLVGDTAGMVVFGHPTTLPVTVDLLLPLVQAVVRNTSIVFVLADLPFGSYQSGPKQALRAAVRYLKEGGAHGVKLEGGARVLPHVEALAAAGIPVMGHLGLTPQSVHALGGTSRVQGRGDDGAVLLRDARALEAAGAFAVLLEAVPASLGSEVAEALAVPVIGIGAGPGVDAQVLVWQDLAGLTPGRAPRFVRRYTNLDHILGSATKDFARDVAARTYPSAEESYS
jgi:3-methyl-2-oxobutanoate hydroxymethyltransferase